MTQYKQNQIIMLTLKLNVIFHLYFNKRKGKEHEVHLIVKE